MSSQDEDTVLIANFDIGKANFSHWIEEVKLTDVDSLVDNYNTLKKSKKGIANLQSEEYKAFLKKVYALGRRIHTGVYDIRNSEKQDVYDMETRRNLITHMESLNELWERCDVFSIEQQFLRINRGRRGKMAAGVSANMDAIKISEALMLWLLDKHPNKMHGFFPSSYKTLMLGAPPKLKDKERKVWCTKEMKVIAECREDASILELFSLRAAVKGKRLGTDKRRDEFVSTHVQSDDVDIVELANKLVRKQKFDDVGDACCMSQAYKIRHLIIGLPFGA